MNARVLLSISLIALLSPAARSQTRSPPGCDITDWPLAQVLVGPSGLTTGIARGDFNGDGQMDVAASSSRARPSSSGPAHGVVLAWHGVPGGFESVPATVIYGNPNQGLGGSLGSAGDVNGDGHEDLVVATALVESASRMPTAFVFLGGRAGLSPAPAWELPASLRVGDTRRVIVAGLGDINADDFDDIGVIADFADFSAGIAEQRIYAFHGGPAGPSLVADAVIPASGGRWISLAGAGDVNGDGFGDVVAGVGPPGDPVVRVFMGSSSGLVLSVAAEIPETTPDARFGAAVAAAGDIDGDSLADILIGEPSSFGWWDPGRMHLYRWTASSVTRTWTSEQGSLDLLTGRAVLGPGDIDGDGWPDVLAGSDAFLPLRSSIPQSVLNVWFGSATGLRPRAELIASEIGPMHGLGQFVTALGDINGDGRSDVAASMNMDDGPLGVVVVLGQAPNHAPTVSAGASRTIDCGDTHLSATASDPDGDLLAYTWESDCPDTVFSPSADMAAPVAHFDPACDRECTLTVTADDGRCGIARSSLIVTVDDRTAPVLAGVPPATAASCDSVPAPAPVTARDGCDPAPAVVIVEIRRDGACAWSYTLERTWTATDACGNETSETGVINVTDRVAPTVTRGNGDLHCTWPPNGRVVRYALDRLLPAVADNCDPSPVSRLVGCTVLEDGLTLAGLAGECGVSDDGSELWVHARRSGTARDGRRYAVIVQASDACGNASVPETIGFIRVPHDSRPASRCE